MQQTTMTPDLQERAAEGLRLAFGRAPAAAGFAPGRVNLIGDHTDYNDGFVMPFALDVGCVTVGDGRGPKGTLAAYAIDMDERAEVDARGPITPESVEGKPAWFRYVAGVFECFRQAAGLPELSGVELALTSSVPTGSGLSSSAAVEVSVATFLESLTGVTVDPLAKAKLAQKAEHLYANVPCGLMDQLASTMGRADHALKIDCRSNDVTPTPLPAPDEVSLFIVDSMVKHDNASGTYAQRRAACERAAEKLGLKALRDLPADWESKADGLLDAVELTAAQHVYGENRRVGAFAEAMAAGDLPAAGRFMTESHESLATLYKVSCDELDLLVELLNQQDGVHGARLSGAGLGGWVVAMADASAAEEAVAKVRASFHERQGVEPRWRMVQPMDGARPLDV